MNVVNLLEVYYDFYRAYDKKTADEMIIHVENSIINSITEIEKPLLLEAGRLKANHKMSLAHINFLRCRQCLLCGKCSRTGRLYGAWRNKGRSHARNPRRNRSPYSNNAKCG